MLTKKTYMFYCPTELAFWTYLIFKKFKIMYSVDKNKLGT